MSWNRKYRPKNISELHLTDVRQQLEQLLKEGRIPQTMLFAGPKGTGKTSTARILGALLNDPANSDAVETVFLNLRKTKNPIFKDLSELSPMLQNILDGNSYIVNEMDAASNRGIDDIRFLKERVSLTPQDGLISVYILDEAHMLTTEAFNALLKLLEEPPKHVLFILATTEIHKIPPTIISRCQVINFKKATREEIRKALTNVIKSEKLKADDADIDTIIKKSDGSFRDALKIAELSVKDNQISTELLNSSVFGNLDSEIEKLISNITQKNSHNVILQFEGFRLQQLDPIYLHKRLLELLHHSLMSSFKINTASEIVSKEIAQFLLVHLSDPQLSAFNPLPHLPLELKILSIIEKAQKNNSTKESPKKVVKETIVVPVKISKKVETENKNIDADLTASWPEFIDEVKNISAHIGLLLQSTKVLSFGEGLAKIAVYYQFHHQQLNSSSVLDILSQVAESYYGISYDFVFKFLENKEDGELDPKLAAATLM